MSEKPNLMQGPLKVVNIGLDGFAQDLKSQGVEVQNVDWSPPAGGDPKLATLLSKLGS
jgi:FdrA protein